MRSCPRIREGIRRAGRVLLLAAVPVLPCGAMAQGVGMLSVHCTVPEIQVLEASSGTYVFPNPTEDDFNAGFVQGDGALTVAVKSNTAWEVTVSTRDTSLGTVNGHTKPLDDLLFRTGGGAFRPISSSPAVLDSLPSATSGKELDLDLRMLLDWEADQAGAYGLSLTFTLISSE